MTVWLKWAAPSAIVISIASPGYCAQYLSIEEAQKLAFPTATQFVFAPLIYSSDQIAAIEKRSDQKVLSRGEQIWKAQAGETFLGYFVVDYVIGKHLVIDYAVALDPTGRVSQVEILQYRESYGGDVRNPGWLAQFSGKTGSDALEAGGDIRIISGATLSSRHVTEGVKRVLAIYETCLK